MTALTGFQVVNLIPYFAKILPQLLGLYTDTENVSPCSETSQIKEIIAPNERLITAPNGVYTSNQSGANPGKRHGPAAWSHDHNTKNSRAECCFAAFGPKHPVQQQRPCQHFVDMATVDSKL
ncbi:hypothetical protein DSO57_1033306 [Entomophthora muscae]|uniref:Uncharacterized protein n=1 Tax=Entomophthora muscae TaxID=34485 RepID=A0ACC2SCZ8_9FUNG|nr:hypothetical protein DSO57_1033306 [Entomophthora muscae]